MTEPNPRAGLLRLESPGARDRLFDHLVGLILGGIALAVLVWTPDMGFTRDEGFYFKAAKDYLGWFEELENNVEEGNTDESLTQENIDKHWSYNPEHPALIKSLFALSYRAFSQERELMAPSTAMRFPTMVFVAVLIWLLYVFMAEAFSRVAGLFACVALLSVPRVFFHAHLACFDAAMMTMWFLVIWGYWKSLRSRLWVVLVALLWGISLSTKLNGFFIPAVLLMHWALTGWAEFSISRRHREDGGFVLKMPKIPAAFFSMITLGMVVFYLLWPRHWYESFGRVAWYVERHLAHEHYAVYYFGDLLAMPPFPREFPFVMSWYTIPLVTLVAIFVGFIVVAVHGQLKTRSAYALQRTRAVFGGRYTSWLGGLALAIRRGNDQDPYLGERWRKGRATARSWRPNGEPPSRDYQWDERGTILLMVLGSIIPFLIIAREETPIFGGVKHWMTAMPFLCGFAGIGFAWTFEHLLARLRLPSVFLRGVVAAALVPVVLWPAIRDTAHSHPYGTAYYNELMGGYIGAADAQMHRQFWGYASRGGLEFLNEHADENSSVHFHNTLSYSFDMYHEDGLLRRDIRYGWSLESAQYVMYHHQRAFHPFLYEIWATYGTTSPVYVVGVDGVPMLSIYENPNWRGTGPVGR